CVELRHLLLRRPAPPVGVITQPVLQAICVEDDNGRRIRDEREVRALHVSSGLTSELTGTQRHCAAWRTLTSPPCGAMPLRVRGERAVMRHLTPKSSHGDPA